MNYTKTIDTDSYYEIGAGHTYCEDYADSGVINTGDNLYHYAIVCDGCSGSKGSDIGARVLAKKFPSCFKLALQAHKETGTKLDEILGYFLSISIKYASETLVVPMEAFDATLVATVYDQLNDTLHSFAWGDGKIYYKFKGEHGHLIDIGYMKNAPFYLSYKAIPHGEAKYESAFGTSYADVIQSLVKSDGIVMLQEANKYQQKSFYEKYIEASKTISFVSVFTDGIDTYHSKNDVNTLIPRHNLFNQLTQYKNRQGDFVERRMNKVKQFCQKEGWQHFDDIAVSTIML